MTSRIKSLFFNEHVMEDVIIVMISASSDTHARCLGIPYPFTSTVGFYDGFFSVFVLANAAFSLVAYNTVRDQSERLFYTPFRSFFIARLDINNRIEFKENKHI